MRRCRARARVHHHIGGILSRSPFPPVTGRLVDGEQAAPPPRARRSSACRAAGRLQSTPAPVHFPSICLLHACPLPVYLLVANLFACCACPLVAPVHSPSICLLHAPVHFPSICLLHVHFPSICLLHAREPVRAPLSRSPPVINTYLATASKRSAARGGLRGRREDDGAPPPHPPVADHAPPRAEEARRPTKAVEARDGGHERWWGRGGGGGRGREGGPMEPTS